MWQRRARALRGQVGHEYTLKYSSKFDTQTSRPFSKGPFAALKDSAYVFSDTRILKPTALIAHQRKLTWTMRATRRDDHLISVSVHDQVRIVGNDNNLPPNLGFSKSRCDSAAGACPLREGSEIILRIAVPTVASDDREGASLLATRERNCDRDAESPCRLKRKASRRIRSWDTNGYR
jgi:hypothetical protein